MPDPRYHTSWDDYVEALAREEREDELAWERADDQMHLEQDIKAEAEAKAEKEAVK